MFIIINIIFFFLKYVINKNNICYTLILATKLYSYPFIYNTIYFILNKNIVVHKEVF